jgi:hypothetical protein
VVVLFGLSVLAPLGEAPLASISGASSSPTAAAAATSSAASSSSASTSAAPVTPAATPAAGAGPHPGTLEVYEVAPGGAFTVDPAAAYYTVDDEVISNVYETLISFNGTDTGPTATNWVPEIATCVPGSVQCSAETGSSLVYDNATTGLPQYYTFEISAGAKFYDPSTKVSWNVYPSDVLFSFARTDAFANLPGEGVYNGWINAQWALPAGNPNWDGGIHTPFNNTPADVLSSILVNDSAYCPASTLPTNGCVTFDVGASGEAWGYFLELMSDPLGGSITPCGVFTYLGAGLPGFYGTTAAHGDGPCLLPGNTTSSTSAAFHNYLTTVSPTAWDAVEELAATGPLSPQTAVQYAMVGSGPYYLVSISVTGGPGGSGGYVLAANPTYVAPAGCAGEPNCLPEPGNYIPNADVYWDNDDTYGLQEAVAGQADSFDYIATDTSTVLDLVHTGTYGLLTNVTTGDNWNMMFELEFNTTNEAAIDPYGAGATNVPGNFLANLGLREFLVQAYPYTSIENTINTVDGVVYNTNYGGAIPPAQAFYYPTNISWPGCNGPATDPCTSYVSSPSVGPAPLDWTNITTPSNPQYDPQLAACTPSTPCTFAIQGWVGNPSLDATMEAWIAAVKSLTGGAIQMYYFDITGTELESQVLSLGDGASSLPVYNWGWVPDYADPSDYMLPFWEPNGTFSYGQAFYPTFYQPAYDDVAACGHNDTTSFANLAYWASQTSILTECQGVAYQVMNEWNQLATHQTNITFRVLEYNMIEHIGNLLALEVYAFDENAEFTYGTWLSPTGINMNPSVGGGGVQTWYTWTYVTDVFQESLQESTLPAASTFSATLSGKTLSTTTVAGTNYLNFTGLANGSYPWSVAFVSGYGASPANGTAVVHGANLTETITFAALGTPTAAVNFVEAGLVSNTTWAVVVQNVGALSSKQPVITFALPANATGWFYGASVVVGYTIPPAGTIITTGATAATVNITYSGVILTTYAVTFASTGLPTGDTWTVSLAGFSLSSTSANITFYEENGTYKFTLSVPSAVTPPATAGQVAVIGVNTIVAVPLSAPGAGFALTFDETGLPTGSPWNITVNGFGIQSTTTSLSFTMPNGTYNWTVSTIGGWIATFLSGSVVVNGTIAIQRITFVPFTYAVTFFEGGLATGASWTVTVAGTNYSSSTYYQTVDLANGTWAFTVPTVTGYLATPSSGNVTVSAAPATQVIIFGPIPETYTVTFTESHLPTGASWKVYFGTQESTVTTSSVSFTATNGTWTYAIIAPSGQAATPSGGSITVNGMNVTQAVSFGPSSTTVSPSSTFLSSLAYGLIGLFVVLTVVFLALALYWRGRKPPAAAPPQSWEGSSQTGETGTTESTEGSTPPTT